MKIADSSYHSILRIGALTLALVLLFVSGILSPLTKSLTVNTGQYLASAVGASASVKPTEINQITAALTEQKTELDKREAAIKEREIAIGLSADEVEEKADFSSFVLSILLFVILVLMILNYVLDYQRWRLLVETEKV